MGCNRVDVFYIHMEDSVYRLFMNDTLNPPIMLLVHIIVFLNFQAPKKKNEEKK